MFLVFWGALDSSQKNAILSFPGQGMGTAHCPENLGMGGTTEAQLSLGSWSTFLLSPCTSVGHGSAFWKTSFPAEGWQCPCRVGVGLQHSMVPCCIPSHRHLQHRCYEAHSLPRVFLVPHLQVHNLSLLSPGTLLAPPFHGLCLLLSLLVLLSSHTLFQPHPTLCPLIFYLCVWLYLHFPAQSDSRGGAVCSPPDSGSCSSALMQDNPPFSPAAPGLHLSPGLHLVQGHMSSLTGLLHHPRARAACPLLVWLSAALPAARPCRRMKY